MSAFEICLVILALIAAGLGGHATGYARGRRVRPRYRRTPVLDQTNIYMQGYRHGREAARAEERERRSRITRPMPVVPVSVDGDEVRPSE